MKIASTLRIVCTAAAALCLTTGIAKAQDNDHHEQAKARKEARQLLRAEDGVASLRDVFTKHGYTIVRTTPYKTYQYVYYRQGNGTVHRAIVRPGSSQLTFENVPAPVLSEVWTNCGVRCRLEHDR